MKCIKTEVFYSKSDMHVRTMGFSILCTSTDSSDKTQLIYDIAVFVCIQIRYFWKQAELQYRVQQQI